MTGEEFEFESTGEGGHAVYHGSHFFWLTGVSSARGEEAGHALRAVAVDV